jgi:hypothetical protein
LRFLGYGSKRLRHPLDTPTRRTNPVGNIADVTYHVVEETRGASCDKYYHGLAYHADSGRQNFERRRGRRRMVKEWLLYILL